MNNNDNGNNSDNTDDNNSNNNVNNNLTSLPLLDIFYINLDNFKLMFRSLNPVKISSPKAPL